MGPGLAETFHTPDILEEGIEYICDWCNDDQPYRMKVAHGSLVSFLIQWRSTTFLFISSSSTGSSEILAYAITLTRSMRKALRALASWPFPHTLHHWRATPHQVLRYDF